MEDPAELPLSLSSDDVILDIQEKPRTGEEDDGYESYSGDSEADMVDLVPSTPARPAPVLPPPLVSRTPKLPPPLVKVVRSGSAGSAAAVAPLPPPLVETGRLASRSFLAVLPPPIVGFTPVAELTSQDDGDDADSAAAGGAGGETVAPPSGESTPVAGQPPQDPETGDRKQKVREVMVAPPSEGNGGEADVEDAGEEEEEEEEEDEEDMRRRSALGPRFSTVSNIERTRCKTP